jgi:hypothetical protein
MLGSETRKARRAYFHGIVARNQARDPEVSAGVACDRAYSVRGCILHDNRGVRNCCVSTVDDCASNGAIDGGLRGNARPT